MPRRRRADPFSLALGSRVRQLRQEAGLTLEKLAYESDLGSKGHLSSIEHGLVRPTAHTLKVLAERLQVLPLDLLTFPEEDERQLLIERTRRLPMATLRRLVRELPAGAPPKALRAAEQGPGYGAARSTRRPRRSRRR